MDVKPSRILFHGCKTCKGFVVWMYNLQGFRRPMYGKAEKILSTNIESRKAIYPITQNQKSSDDKN